MLSVVGVTARIIVLDTHRSIILGAHPPLATLMFDNGADAVMGALGLLAIVVGRRLKRFELGIDRLHPDGFWGYLIRRQIYRIAILSGLILFLSGVVQILTSFILAPHPLSQMRLIANSISMVAGALGFFAMGLGDALRRLENRIPTEVPKPFTRPHSATRKFPLER